MVDDCLDTTASMEFLLDAWGHSVRVCNDGRMALDLALDFGPDVVLLDVAMPRMDGYELARRLRARPELDRPWLICVSGYGRPEDSRRALDAGCDLHLVKPFEVEEMRHLLDALSLQKIDRPHVVEFALAVPAAHAGALTRLAEARGTTAARLVRQAVGNLLCDGRSDR